MDIGTHLRTSRERRGLSLDDLASRTKINPRVLRALEGGDAASLPPAIFVRGFLRSYAREVGLDPEAIVREYTGQIGAAAPAGPVPAAPEEEFVHDELVIGSRHQSPYLGDGPNPISRFGGLALAAVALAAVAYLSIPERSDAPAADEVVLASPAEASSGAIADDPPVVGTAGRALTLEIRPTGPCWVEVRVNGEARVYRLMQGGEHEMVTTSDAVMLRVGDPTVFTYSINGRPGRPLGMTSRPVSVRISSANLPEFIG